MKIVRDGMRNSILRARVSVENVEKMAKKRDLPPELKKPIRVDQILAEIVKLRRAGLKPDARQLMRTETRRRVALLLQYLGSPWPENEDDWLKLIVRICSHLNVPGFQLALTGSGAKKKWPVWKNFELIIDVQSLRHKNKRLSDFGACQYIARHPEKYDNRYPKNPTTLHRQFLRAKSEFDPSDLDSVSAAMVLDHRLEREFLESERRIYEKLITQQSQMGKIA